MTVPPVYNHPWFPGPASESIGETLLRIERKRLAAMIRTTDWGCGNDSQEVRAAIASVVDSIAAVVERG